MIIPLLTLPSVDGATVAALRQLGRGLRLPFQVGDLHGELLLEPGKAPSVTGALCFETAHGVLALSEPGPLLSLLGECPVTLAETGNDPDSWFWALFQHHLSPQVQALLGYLRLRGEARPAAFGCRLTVRLGPSRVVGHLRLSPESFLALCEAGPWQSVAGQLPASFPLAVAVTLGRLQLPVAQLSSVRSGDVLILEQPLFGVQGTGHVHLGKHRLHVHLDDETGPLCLTLISIEETSMDEDFAEHSYPALEPEPYADDEPPMDEFGHEPFDELTMSLNVRCGTLKLTLGELRQLAPGSVLGVSGYAPGTAGLYYGDRPIGQGQLVDVDGRLGLQLSRVIFAR